MATPLAMGAGDDPEVRGTGERRTTWRGLIGWVERLAYAAGDTEETRRRKVQFISANILVVPAGLIWGALYFAYGEPAVCVFPLAYAVLTFVNLSLFVRVRRYELFRYVQQCMILVLPFELQIGLGGFVGSGTVIFWSFVAVLMAVLFGDIREARWWFAAYAAAVVAAAWLQPLLVIRNHLPNRLVLTFFVLNLVVVSSVVFAVLYSFVTDRRKLRELEVAFLNQDIMLRNSEKLATLGTLAAGVAHELNNPAAATRRAADQLRSAFARLEQAHLRLGSANLTDEERELLRSLEQRARERAAGPVNLDPLARSDQETAVEEWLEVQGVADPGDLAPSLVGLGLDRQELSRVFAAFDNETSSVVLTWAASAFPVYSLLYEINQGSARISEIVGALRSYSYLGQAPVQMVDLREGLDDTLVILRHKLKAGINVHREYGADVPKVPAYGSELNQVWTNLLDNAADAMGGKGEITIRTRRQQNWAVVEIEDNGPGIPQEIQPRIFDPFFTTKAPGKGTGLGLSTSQAIVTQKHKGELHLESRPGLTRFVVKLPIDPPPVAAPAPGRTGATTPSA